MSKTCVMVVTIGAILVALLVIRHVLPERFLALFAHERDLHRLCERMRLRFGMTFRAVVPLLATGRAYGNLGVQDVLTA
jgi:hypothetical protein